MRRFIKQLYHKTTLGRRFLNPIKKLDEYIRPRILPEKIYIKRTFKNTFGYKLDLKNPKTFNEKILWLQQNDRKPLHTLCADKYDVREYIKEKIGEQYLIPLVLKTTNPKDIVPENLPDYPFIIKTNHGCGGHVIVKDKSKIEWKNVQRNLAKLLKSNYYHRAREWQYKNIKPCIVVEKLLLDENSNIPNDYALHCFNGTVEFIGRSVYIGINRKSNYYDEHWNLLDLRIPRGVGVVIERPKNLTKIKSLAEILANDFRYVRVDLYNMDSKIYFSELTFSPFAGFFPFNPSYWDRKFGDKLKLY